MSYERGDVVIATDPFKDGSSGRPFLLVSTDQTPFHGEQFIAVSLTTRTWYDDRIPLVEADWVAGGAPKSSSVMPWSINTLKREWIDTYQGRIHSELVDRVTERVIDYVRE